VLSSRPALHLVLELAALDIDTNELQYLVPLGSTQPIDRQQPPLTMRACRGNRGRKGEKLLPRADAPGKKWPHWLYTRNSLMTRSFKCPWHFCLLLISMVVTSNAVATTFPKGWRPVNAKELSDDWRAKDVDKYARTTGDFNGDGRIDQAMLLISDRRHSLGLFILTKISATKSIWHKLGKISVGPGIRATGIQKIAPGRYLTGCGKDYWPCSDKEPEWIESLNPVIDYFKTEGANRYIYFEKSTNRFRKKWMSD
jgi:hypothetical protein